jgi:hypothetical protein
MGDDGGVRTLAIIVLIALGTILLLAFILLVLEQPGDDE